MTGKGRGTQVYEVWSIGHDTEEQISWFGNACMGTLCQTLIFLAKPASHEQRAQITRHIEWASCCVPDTKEVPLHYKERHQVECSLRWLLPGHEPTTINQYHAVTGQSKNNYAIDMEQNQRCSDREKTSWSQTCTRKFEASSWNYRLWSRKTC